MEIYLFQDFLCRVRSHRSNVGSQGQALWLSVLEWKESGSAHLLVFKRWSIRNVYLLQVQAAVDGALPNWQKVGV